MDLNKQYAAHQKALIFSKTADSDADRRDHLAKAEGIAREIGTFQLGLGAAAACAWCAVNLTAS